MALGKNYVSTIIKRSVIFILIGCVTCFFLFEKPMPYISGLLLGGLANIFCFKILELSAKKAVNMPENKAKTHATLNYIFRYFVYAIALVIAAKINFFNFIAVIAALFTIKLVIVTDTVYDTFHRKMDLE